MMSKNFISKHYRIILFLIAGLVNTSFGYMSYALLVMTKMPLWLAITASMIAAFLFNFLTYGGVVFKNMSRRNLTRFLVFYSVVGIFNYELLRVIENFGIVPLWGQALSLPLLSVICYLGMKLFVFRTPTGARSLSANERYQN